MRIAIVGLGKIAQKAYLPVISARQDMELIFCTRDRSTLDRLSEMYRVKERVVEVRDLPRRKVDAAFVHTSTESHLEVAGELLRSGIHVYLDKPIAYSFEQSQELVELAERSGRILMVGFNRRFAPMYKSLSAVEDRRVILMQKNRPALPDYARRFVFDDFIHVVDTMRFISPGEIKEVRVSSFQKAGLLHHLLLHLEGDGFAATGLMNRDSGASEETLEVMSPGNKWLVRGLDTTVHYREGEERITRFDDWDSVLQRRGFTGIVDHFLHCARHDVAPLYSARDALDTHSLCERIVSEAEQNGAEAWGPRVV
jgi:virulence factor